MVDLTNYVEYCILFLKSKKDGLDDLILKMAIVNCIDTDECKITIPNELLSMFDFHPTNDLIAKYTSDEWIGLEVKFLPEIQEKIKSLADEKRKSEELRAQNIKDSLDELSTLLGRL